LLSKIPGPLSSSCTKYQNIIRLSKDVANPAMFAISERILMQPHSKVANEVRSLGPEATKVCSQPTVRRFCLVAEPPAGS
jgi:hypothetical protein